MNLIAAAYAPMKEDLNLNVGVIEEYALFLKSNGIKGAFINGSTGDFVSLSTEERMILAEYWSKHRSEDFKVINHVGHNSLLEGMKLAEHAKTYCDGIAVLPPFYFKLTKLQDLLYYCKCIAGVAQELPFYYYHIPVLSGAHFSMKAFIEEAIQQIPNFRGVKYTNNDFIDLQECLYFNKNEASDLSFYFGIDELFINSLPLGVHGWVGSTYNHLAPLYANIYRTFQSGDYEKALYLQSLSVSFVKILSDYGGFNGAGKSFMQMLGVDCGPSRFPHITLSLSQLEKIKESFEIHGFSNSCFSQMSLSS